MTTTTKAITTPSASPKIAIIVGVVLLALLNVLRSQRSTISLLVTAPAEGPQSDIDFVVEEQNDLHIVDENMIPLTSWENNSLYGVLLSNTTQKGGIDTCHPPLGISPRCCFGTFSSGGEVDPYKRYKCNAALREGLGMVIESTNEFFQDNPITTGVSCDVCRIVEVARKHNLTVVFVGDSLQTQVFQGLLCELQRHNYQLTSNMTKWFPKRPLFYFKIGISDHVTIRSDYWEEHESVPMKFYMVYMMGLANEEIEQQRRLVLSSGNVFVFGFGLHWHLKKAHPLNSRSAYVKAMTDLFRNASDAEHVRLVIHRETSAQHFNATGGLYESLKSADRDKPQTCVPIQASKELYWRTEVIQEAASLAGLEHVVSGPNMPPRRASEKPTELIVLPYLNFTTAMYHQHVQPGSDCTHFCSTPYIYMPLWRSLRFALDRQFG